MLDGAGGDAPQLIAGRYRLEARIARGGMGTVYRVFDQVRQQPCALKRVDTAGDARRRTRMFEREFNTLAGLKHPRIIEVYDYGVDEQGAYYTMELLDGRDLHELAPLPYTTACRYLRDVASSLALLHARNLLHRDLSPRNVRITSDERAKLLDFGALASFGRSTTLVGTPPFVPLEALELAELDQRADLYSLGALAYWLLTGHHAYDVRAIADLRAAWAREPPPPSEVAPRERVPPIPKPLDDLVLALLSHDPLARPASAAEVIARLSTIANLPADREPLSALSYLQGIPTVGRTRERAQLRRRMKAALAGSGSVALVHAEAGMGSARILGELAIEARLLGACAVVVDAAQHRGSYGVAQQIVQGLFHARPDKARAAMAEHEALLARFVDGTVTTDRISVRPAGGTSGNDPREARLRTQTALVSWLDRLSQETPLVVAVRGFHHADDSSATLLCALGPLLGERHMLVVLVSDPDVPAVAPAAHAGLREIATPVHLRGLSRDELRLLVEGTFGEIPDTERLVAWLHELTGGKPQACIDLLRHLVEQDVIRFTDGVWALPREIAPHELPADLGEALALRLSRLSADALRLVRALCVHRGPIAIERALAVAALESVAAPQRVLAELEEHGVMLADEDNLRFRHASLRDAAQRPLGPDELRRLHAQLGALIAREGGADITAQLDAGWHLLHGGEERRGADLLASAGLELTHDADLLPAAIPALEAALAAFRKQGRSLHELAGLLGPLANCAVFSDRRLGDRYGDEASVILRSVLGLRVVGFLRPLLGGKISLLIGLATGLVGFAFAVGPRKALESLRHYLELFSTMTIGLTGIAALSLDGPRARRHARTLAPFKAMGEDHALAVCYRYASALAKLPEDRIAEAHAGVQYVLAQVEGDRPPRDMSREVREMMRRFALYALGSLECFRQDPEALRIADRLEATGSKLFEMFANQIRATYHGLSGEEDTAQRHREQVEQFAVQAGSSWQAEIWSPSSALLCYKLTVDIVGLQRAARQLERLAQDLPSLRRHALLANAAIAAARGDIEQARALALPIINAVEPRAFVGWAATLSVEIRCLCALGEAEQGRQLGERVLALYDARDRSVSTMIAPLVIELALAEAQLGMAVAADARIEAYLSGLGDRGGAATRGALHEARARIALRSGDAATAEQQLARMERCFQPTYNPVLVARCERLRRELQAESAERVRTSQSFELGLSATQIVRRALHECRSEQQRFSRALEMLLDHAGATRGAIFDHEAGELVVRAAVGGFEATPEQRAALHEQLAAACQDDSVTVSTGSERSARESQACDPDVAHALVLTARRGERREPIGAALIAQDGKALRVPPPALLSAIADGLGSDVTSAVRSRD
jgi:tRNA A-37 threonylcarbamoyl transferase component Bud32